MRGEGNPWTRITPPRRAGFLIWLALLAAAGAGIWFLAYLLPGRAISGWDQAFILRAFLVLALVSGGLIFLRRVPLAETLRNVAIWAGIAGIIALGFAFQEEIRYAGLRLRAELLPGMPVTTGVNELVLTQAADGHFYVIGEANGTPVRFLVDTGASETVLSPADAARIGIELGSLSFNRSYSTANGIGLGAPLTLRSLSIGPIVLSDVPVSVNQAEMGTSLLGMSFLRTLGSFEVRDRRLYLRWQ